MPDLHVAAGPLDTDLVNTMSGLLLLSLAVGMVGMIVLVLSPYRTGTVGLGASLEIPASFLLLGAALIHLAVAPDHFGEYVPYGLAFLGLAAVQAGLAGAYWRGRGGSAVDAMTLVVSVGTLVVWIWSRLSGLPFGPLPNQPEAVAGNDLAASAFELAVIGIAAVRLARRARRLSVSGATASAARAFTLAAVGLITVLVITGPHPNT